MSSTSIYVIAFLSQILTVSQILARRVEERLIDDLGRRPDENVSKHGDPAVLLERYRLANNVITVIGIVLLFGLVSAGNLQAVRSVLLATGGFFFLQVAPAVFIRGPLREWLRPRDPSGASDSADALRPFDVVSPVPLVAAALVLLVYVTSRLWLWEPGGEIQLVKALIVGGANLYVAALVIRQLTAFRRSRGIERVRRTEELRKTVPTLGYISIGVTLYWFGKDLIAHFDASVLRPTVMSITLQLLALLVFTAALPGWASSTAPPRP